MSHTPEQRQKSINAELSGEKYWVDNMQDNSEACSLRELISDTHSTIQYIQDMIICLPSDKDGTRWYTCKHWDKETGLCKEYDNRPGMCRDFPYGKKCFVKKCKYKQ